MRPQLCGLWMLVCVTNGLSNHWATHWHLATETVWRRIAKRPGTHASVIETGLVCVVRGFPLRECRHSRANGLRLISAAGEDP